MVVRNSALYGAPFSKESRATLACLYKTPGWCLYAASHSCWLLAPYSDCVASRSREIMGHFTLAKLEAPSPNGMVIWHDQSWQIMINLQILSWKSSILIKSHQKSQNVMKSHHVKWNIYGDLIFMIFGDMKFDHQKSWKMFHLPWWFLVINHDQSWFPNSNWELGIRSEPSH